MTCIHYKRIIDNLRSKIKYLETERENYINFSSRLVGISSDLSSDIDSCMLLSNLCKEIIVNGSYFDEGEFEKFARVINEIINEISLIQSAIAKCIAEINDEIAKLQNQIASYSGRDCASCQEEDEKDDNSTGSNTYGGGR
ncbi:MAG: hypothetical protein IJB83_04840 [Bacilli bacterium]|nr:hypothetical protein [Bacilli bacterium]